MIIILKMKSPIEYIKEAWAIYTKKENFVFFAKIMAVLVIINTLLGYLINYLFPVQNWENLDFQNIPVLIGFVCISLVAFLVNMWTYSTMYMAILKMGKDEKEIFRLGYKKMWKYFLITFVVTLIVMLGLVLLIVPGVMFGIWYSFSLFLVLDKSMGIKASLKQSKEMVKGKFWKIFVVNAVIMIISFIFGMIANAIPYAGSILISFVMPLFSLPSYLLYRDLSTRN